MQPRFQGLLKDPTACTLIAGDSEAVFLPAHGMLGASFRHRGVQILGRIDDLEAAASKGSTAGVPLLYPWANRLPESRYSVLGKQVALDLSSPLLHLDEHGLPMHGVPWALLRWAITEIRRDFLAAQLEWSSSDLLAIFPFRHRVELVVTIHPDRLTVATMLAASADGPIPVSFGFHPYLNLSELARPEWQLELPAMRKLVADDRGIPTGDEQPFGGFNEQLGDRSFDDGFVLLEDAASFTVAGATRRISVDLLEGYRYAQVFAPKDKDYIALEPMTAPAGALATGHGLRVASPGEEFRAVFQIRIDSPK